LVIGTTGDRVRLLRRRQSEGLERRGIGAGRKDGEARADGDLAVRRSEARTGDAIVFDERGDRGQFRQEGCAAGDGVVEQDCIEPFARQARVLTAQHGVTAARRIDAQLAAVPRLGVDAFLGAENHQRGKRIADQAVAAHLVARERSLIGNRDLMAGVGEHARRRRAGRTGPDDEHIAAGRYGHRSLSSTEWPHAGIRPRAVEKSRRPP
jgi:hypothetical protein